MDINRYDFDFRNDLVRSDTGKWVKWDEVAPYLVLFEYMMNMRTAEEILGLHKKIAELEEALSKAKDTVYI